jgi:hypothetical protein
MADPVADIEVVLRRAVITVNDANEQRRRLKASFQQLTPDQAKMLLKRILSWDGSRLPQDFRRPDRAIRLELLMLLVQRLGSQTAAQFFDAVNSDPTLSHGLRMVFPDYAKTQRDKFLAVLKAGTKPAGSPSVLLLFRNTGFFSPDNSAKGLGFRDAEEPDDPKVLRKLGPSPVTGKNKMEIRGTLIRHRADATYRFRRTIEQKSWYLAGTTWKLLHIPLPPETDDNTHTSDEDDHPDNDHIYSIDEPGFRGTVSQPTFVANVPSADRSRLSEAVFMMNAKEMVDVKVGPGAWVNAGQLDWFSVTWLERAGSTWQRKAGLNKIAAGAIPDLDFADEPPIGF